MRPRGDNARLCADCDKLVHDLSGMTEPQARALLRRPRTEGLCIRYLHDEQGNVWFRGNAPTPIVAASRLARRGVAALASAAALVAVPSLIEACGGASPYGVGSDGGYAPLNLAAPGVGAPATDASPENAGPEAAAPEAGSAEAASPEAASPEGASPDSAPRAGAGDAQPEGAAQAEGGDR